MNLNRLWSLVFEGIGNVDGERIVAPLMLPHVLPVDEHLRFPVAGAGVKEYALIADWVDQYRPPIPDPVRRADALRHARESGLDGIRHQDLILVLALAPLLADLKVPQAVQIRPVLPSHLRPRILRKWVAGDDVVGPAGQERAVGRLPLLRLCRHGGGPHETDEDQSEEDGGKRARSAEGLLHSGGRS